MAKSFQVKDCALITLATGRRAQTLKELRDELLEVSEGSIYHHFWARLLRPRFDEPEYNNDFAAWAHHSLHEKPLAERLSMVMPAAFACMEDVRQDVVEIVEQRLDETELSPWARTDQQFHFLEARVVIFDTGIRVGRPEDLISALPEMPTGSVYYHFVDARRRWAGEKDDFSVWLEGFGPEYGPLVEQLRNLDPYFSSLKEIRHELAQLLGEALGGEGHV